VAERVPVVEDRRSPSSARPRPRPCLRRRSGHDPLERRRVSSQHRRGVALQQVQELAVEYQGVLHDLRQAGSEVSVAERRQRVHVGDDEPRLGERSDEVLALRQVDGRLAADRRVDLCQERGRHLNERDASHVRRGDEPGEIADRSPSQRDHRIVTMGLLGGELM
jgi:hypothetical protein